MPTKTTKTASVKKTTTKKTAKKPAVTAKVAKTSTACEPEMHAHQCGCTQFNSSCMCASDCHCHKGCSSFFKKLIVALLLLALGFYAGTTVCPRGGMRGPRVEFAPNGCMIEESVKCPKLRASLVAMDINQDGCITRDEYRAVKRQMRQEIREIQIQEVENTPQQHAE